jgi:flagellar basal body rod protein FlgB
MNDVTMTALHTALRGLSTRQRVIADNVANIQTPGSAEAEGIGHSDQGRTQ